MFFVLKEKYQREVETRENVSRKVLADTSIKRPRRCTLTLPSKNRGRADSLSTSSDIFRDDEPLDGIRMARPLVLLQMTLSTAPG
jgi:hypothetical protein